MAPSETIPLLPTEEFTVEAKPRNPSTLKMCYWVPAAFLCFSSVFSFLLIFTITLLHPLLPRVTGLVTDIPYSTLCKTYFGALVLIFGLGCGMESLAYVWWLLMRLLTRDDSGGQKFEFPVLEFYAAMFFAITVGLSRAFGIDRHVKPIEEGKESVTT
ncbi:hypothetical protein F4813DRAFT_360745 [Daldinia decipiens]|uniref:uncharacterized protein n=1 Tax=Daldinia decipiens TaxID=326647 RepID=UPI0020C29400|nr:uncharacterized protein F4813DRAFT_360745 [Daldinia decipiens]KAI1657229.1 hypothetical protein F4813DRAFT_360745 [Daldinia decipiens]